MTLTGELACPQGVPNGEQPVAVYQRERGRGASGFSQVATSSTEADGSYHVTVAAVEANSVFYTSSAGTRSKPTVVRTAPAVTLNGPAGSELSTRGDHLGGGRHIRYTFTGTSNPSPTGALVALQREYTASGEQWRTIAFGRVGADGSFSITHGFRTPGEVSVRVVVHAKGANVAGVSKALTYEVAETQNPRLTIHDSADPISSGQSVTITGVASGAGEQAVELLSRTPGHALALVDKATTDKGGNYTFTTSPEQSTTYVVTSATTSSSELFEGFRYLLTTGVNPAAVAAGQQLSFSGTLVPAHEGQRVYLEMENVSGFGFHVVGEGAVNGTSSYSIAYAFNVVGTRQLRIKVPANSESVGTTSEPFSVAVMHPLAPVTRAEEPGGSSAGQAQP